MPIVFIKNVFATIDTGTNGTPIGLLLCLTYVPSAPGGYVPTYYIYGF